MRQNPLEIVIFCKHETVFPVLSGSQSLHYEDATYCSLRDSISRVSAASAFAEEDILVGSIQYFADTSRECVWRVIMLKKLNLGSAFGFVWKDFVSDSSSLRLGKRGVPSREALWRGISFLKELSSAVAVNSKVGKLFCVLQYSWRDQKLFISSWIFGLWNWILFLVTSFIYYFSKNMLHLQFCCTLLLA